LIYPEDCKKIHLAGTLVHDAYKDEWQADERLAKYAMLAAQQKFQRGKRVSKMAMKLHAALGLGRDLLLRLGILDGKVGVRYAMALYKYNHERYRLLYDMTRASSKD
jgi:hypothetical protein